MEKEVLICCENRKIYGVSATAIMGAQTVLKNMPDISWKKELPPSAMISAADRYIPEAVWQPQI